MERLTSKDYALLLLRFAVGAVFIAHGSQKVFGAWGGQGLEATVAGMSQGGIPAFLGYIAAFTELLGGITVLMGLLSRLGAIGIAIVMSVAIGKVHFPNGFFLAEGGFEFAFVLFLVAVAIALLGPGRIAIADLEGRWIGKRVSRV